MIQTSLSFHRYTMPPSDTGGVRFANTSLLEDSTMVRSGLTRGQDSLEEEDYAPDVGMENANHIPFSYKASRVSTARGGNAPWYTVDEEALENDRAKYVVPILAGDIHQMATR